MKHKAMKCIHGYSTNYLFKKQEFATLKIQKAVQYVSRVLCSDIPNNHHSLKEKNSGPVNAHLTPGPAIYFIAFIPQPQPWGQMLMSTESPYHFAHLLQVLKQSL